MWAQKGPYSCTMQTNLGIDRTRHMPVLYVTVTMTGAAVMILELLGTRIIGPFYGVSLYVWSSLIAVTLDRVGARLFPRRLSGRPIPGGATEPRDSVAALTPWPFPFSPARFSA